jgi:hypothetical protein
MGLGYAGCSCHCTEAGEGVAGGVGDGGEGPGDEGAAGNLAPELGGERGGLVPDIVVRGKRKRRGKSGIGGGIAHGRRPLHGEHVVGGR